MNNKKRKFKRLKNLFLDKFSRLKYSFNEYKIKYNFEYFKEKYDSRY